MSVWRLHEAVGWVRRPGERMRFGRPGDGRTPLRGFDHADFAALLARFVTADGRVRYAAWRADSAAVEALDGYLHRLGTADVAGAADRADRLAFWVNAYNAVTVAGVLRGGPAGCGCRPGWVGFNRFRDVRLWVAGRWWSPDRMEHTVVRPLGEPLTHLALVCGARGCPPLRAYTAAGLPAELAGNARRFLRRPDAFRADPAARTVYLSRLFRWYRRDFARTADGVVRALRPFLPGDLGWLDAGRVRVEYLPYDWSPNDAGPGCAGGPTGRAAAAGPGGW